MKWILRRSYHRQTSTDTWTKNASATFEFNGTSVFVYGGKRSDYGNYTVTLDNMTGTYSAYSQEETVTLLYSNNQMQQGWHTLTITNDGTLGPEGMPLGIDIDSVSRLPDLVVFLCPTLPRYCRFSSSSFVSSECLLQLWKIIQVVDAFWRHDDNCHRWRTTLISARMCTGSPGSS